MKMSFTDNFWVSNNPKRRENDRLMRDCTVVSDMDLFVVADHFLQQKNTRSSAVSSSSVVDLQLERTDRLRNDCLLGLLYFTASGDGAYFRRCEHQFKDDLGQEFLALTDICVHVLKVKETGSGGFDCRHTSPTSPPRPYPPSPSNPITSRSVSCVCESFLVG